eukprot:scaffold301522_cov19-Tisochrysis_lutea.AAC.1
MLRSMKSKLTGSSSSAKAKDKDRGEASSGTAGSKASSSSSTSAFLKGGQGASRPTSALREKPPLPVISDATLP